MEKSAIRIKRCASMTNSMDIRRYRDHQFVVCWPGSTVILCFCFEFDLLNLIRSNVASIWINEMRIQCNSRTITIKARATEEK